MEARKHRQASVDIARRDRQLEPHVPTLDAHGTKAARVHVRDDLDRVPDDRLRPLRPGGVPGAKGVKVVRDAAKHDALVEVDAGDGNLEIADVHVELQDVEVESGGEDADVTAEVLAVRQPDRPLGEALDLAGLDDDGVRAQLVLQPDGHGDPLLPRIVSRPEVRLEALSAHDVEPVPPEDPAREARTSPKSDEDQIVSGL